MLQLLQTEFGFPGIHRLSPRLHSEPNHTIIFGRLHVESRFLATFQVAELGPLTRTNRLHGVTVALFLLLFAETGAQVGAFRVLGCFLGFRDDRHTGRCAWWLRLFDSFDRWSRCQRLLRRRHRLHRLIPRLHSKPNPTIIFGRLHVESRFLATFQVAELGPLTRTNRLHGVTVALFLLLYAETGAQVGAFRVLGCCLGFRDDRHTGRCAWWLGLFDSFDRWSRCQRLLRRSPRLHSEPIHITTSRRLHMESLLGQRSANFPRGIPRIRPVRGRLVFDLSCLGLFPNVHRLFFDRRLGRGALRLE